MDPPQCVQNAMMTKDKKPFTYTPGGIDLSEVRSPRMQRRIERNANLGGASDLPQQAPRPQNVGPLPPATLAAMRPQTQVQVFPGPPPPPPMSKNIPPPPPPPSCPLPTQKVTTNENQVLERPDMTKIIPDNPMALLRKTGGPTPRKSFVEHMYDEPDRTPLNPPSPPHRAYEAQSPRYAPPVTERSAPVSPPSQQQRQPQSFQPSPQQYQPPTPSQNQYQPPQYQPVQPPQPQYQPVQVQQRSTDSPSYQPPIIQRQPTLVRQDQPQRNVSSSVGSLYIPPLNQPQQPAYQQKFASPPTSPEREPQVQSPGTPTLKEAPKPWQQKNVQQQQAVPPWAKRDDDERVQSSQSPPSAPSQRWQQPARTAPQQQPVPQQVRQPPTQQFSPRSPVVQQSSPRTPLTQNQPNSFPVNIEIRAAPYPQDLEPNVRTEAVYVTQPIVLQHPGPLIAPPYQGQPKAQPQQQPSQNSYQQPRQQVQQKPKVDSSGARVIPIQIERTPPSTPAAERGLNRQLSWGSQPTQSNSFKVIQKITRTDDDEDDDTPVTQHSARYPQEMPEQVRKIKINDNGHFKQDVQMYDEENPRYRGGYIPSRIFKILDESVPPQIYVDKRLPTRPRGNGQPQPYVHPSEQVVPEPKKYMGSNIPSRSFKILQAMTAPSDGCANANYNEELPYNPLYNPYNYPYYPTPYWPDYYPNYYPQEQTELPKQNDKSSARSGRTTPVQNAAPYLQPFWHDYYPNFYPQQQSDSSSKMSDKSSSTKSGRSTPLPTAAPIPPPVMPPSFWNYIPQNMSSNAYVRSQSTPPKVENIRRPQTPKPTEYQNNYTEDALQYPPYHMYPPYYDPYYYSYYYGYPPVMPPYPYYPPSTENEEYSGYSSQDEMSNYNGRRSSLKRRNSLENGTNSVEAIRQHFEVRSKSATPRITITPSFSQEKLSFNGAIYKGKENNKAEIEVEEEEEVQKGSELCRLRSIKSVQDIGVYATECSESETSESEESTEDETEEEDEEVLVVQEGEEIIPHQLSIIYEESERGDSRRSFRPSSVASETTTVEEHHSEEEDIDDFLAAQNVKYKINMFQEATEQFSLKSSGHNVKTFDHEKELFTSLSVRNQNLQDASRFFENKSDQSKCVVTKFENNNETNQEEKFNDRNYVARRECDNINTNTKEIKKNAEKQPFTSNSAENVHSEEITTTMISKKDKESNEDWWEVIENDDTPKDSGKSEISIKNDENECDNLNPKAEYVMCVDKNEVVSVKLRDKSNARRNSSGSKTEDIIGQGAKVEYNVSDDIFFGADSGYNRSSIYDILKDNEETEEIESSGTLMKVDSFVSALEAIKRNSGLWNSEENDFGNPLTIKEETDSEDFNYATKEITEDKQSHSFESSSNDNTKYECNEQPNLAEELANQSEESEIDFWSQIKNDEDDFQPRRQSQYFEEEQENENFNTHTDSTNEHKTDSASSRNSSFSKSQVFAEVKSGSTESEADKHNRSSEERYDHLNKNYDEKYQENNDISEETSESDSSDEEPENHNMYRDEKCNSHSRSRSLEPQTIKERIEALRNSIAQKQKMLLQEKEEMSISVKSKISAIEVPAERSSKTTSTKSSVKSFEEYSEEEEGDSGVISDISRHISDNEEFPELKKLTRYERAATHSRLFKLLQDECDIEEEEEEDEVFVQQEDKFNKLSIRQNRGQNKLTPSRSKLSLALDKYNESSDKPQVNEKLVDELLQSLFRSRKAQVFRNMPTEKLRAAAIIILQEGIEDCETLSEDFSSLISPLRGETENSTPAETPQEFYANSEYKQYYDSWSDATEEIVPSKAFKLLQEHFGASKLGTIESILAKYPKILSNKNISKEILRHLDELSSDYSPPYSQTLPQSNDVTNT